MPQQGAQPHSAPSPVYPAPEASRGSAASRDSGAARAARAADIAWDWRGSAGTAAGTERERAAARRRGLIQAAVGLTAAALLALWKPQLAMVVAGIALLTLFLALAFPTTAYRRLSQALETFGHWVGMAVTWVLMTLLYFLFFLPVGLLLRAGRRLGITTAPDRALASYWSAVSGPARTLDSYRKQF